MARIAVKHAATGVERLYAICQDGERDVDFPHNFPMNLKFKFYHGVIITVIVLIIVFKIPAYEYSYRLGPRFRNEVKHSISPYELQRWAVSLIKKYEVTDPTGEGVEIPVKDLPDGLKKVDSGGYGPEMAFFGGRDNEAVIDIIWGGGGGQYGLTVGDSNFRMSDSEGRSVSPWIDGVYFWKAPN